MMFKDRVDAGRRLAAHIVHLRGDDVVVVGLPRGGVPAAAEVARALDAPLDVVVVRKLGVPFQPELGMGALAEDGVRVISAEIVRLAGVGGRGPRPGPPRRPAETGNRPHTSGMAWRSDLVGSRRSRSTS